VIGTGRGGSPRSTLSLTRRTRASNPTTLPQHSLYSLRTLSQQRVLSVSLSLESLHIAEHSGCSGRGFAGRGLLRKSPDPVNLATQQIVIPSSSVLVATSTTWSITRLHPFGVAVAGVTPHSRTFWLFGKGFRGERFVEKEFGASRGRNSADSYPIFVSSGCDFDDLVDHPAPSADQLLRLSPQDARMSCRKMKMILILLLARQLMGY
jgi:hypothetical protein